MKVISLSLVTVKLLILVAAVLSLIASGLFYFSGMVNSSEEVVVSLIAAIFAMIGNIIR